MEKRTVVEFYHGVPKKFEDADFYSTERSNPYLPRLLQKEKLLALQRFYQFCAKHQVADIEIMTLTKEQQFEQELSEEFRGKKRSTMFGILRMSRKILFFTGTGNSLECECVVLERFHFFQRTNESKASPWNGYPLKR